MVDTGTRGQVAGEPWAVSSCCCALLLAAALGVRGAVPAER